MSQTFQAGTTYNDWEGTLAADNADARDIWSVLKERSLVSDDDLPLAIRLYFGEHHPSKTIRPTIETSVLSGFSDYDQIKLFLDRNQGPIPTRAVSLELSLEEFANLFKRLEMVFTKSNLDLSGRAYCSKE